MKATEEKMDNAFDIQKIMKLLPHRYPFIMIDRILELTPGEKVIALKNVTINEPFFQGHFPENPIMPGVLIVEERIVDRFKRLGVCDVVGVSFVPPHPHIDVPDSTPFGQVGRAAMQVLRSVFTERLQHKVREPFKRVLPVSVPIQGMEHPGNRGELKVTLVCQSMEHAGRLGLRVCIRRLAKVYLELLPTDNNGCLPCGLQVGQDAGLLGQVCLGPQTGKEPADKFLTNNFIKIKFDQIKVGHAIKPATLPSNVTHIAFHVTPILCPSEPCGRILFTRVCEVPQNTSNRIPGSFVVKELFALLRPAVTEQEST